jgi:hypothetical protein
LIAIGYVNYRKRTFMSHRNNEIWLLKKWRYISNGVW